MTEIVGTAAERSRLWSLLRGREAERAELARVSFADLARTHHAWAADVRDTQAAVAYGRALHHFEREEGRLEGAYWCTSVPGGAALSVRRRRRRFHRAAEAHPDRRVTALLNECDELSVRVSEVLRGGGQRIAMGLILRTAANLLAMADLKDVTPETLKQESANLAGAQAYYRRAARRQAQLVYLGGMLLGVFVVTAIVLAILAIVHATADVRWVPHVAKGSSLSGEVSLATLYLCAISGALGANVSAASRIDENSFAIDYELGRFTLAALGALRPLLGAVFGIALYAALVSGLLDLFNVPDQDVTKQIYFFLVVAFVAGFSERWAKGVLNGIGVPPHRRVASGGSGGAS